MSSVIGQDYLQHPHRPRVIVDLGIPRNVDPSVNSRLSDVSILDMDTLQEAGQRRRKRIQKQLHQAENIVAEETKRLVDHWIQRQLIREIRDHSKGCQNLRTQELFPCGQVGQIDRLEAVRSSLLKSAQQRASLRLCGEKRTTSSSLLCISSQSSVKRD